MQSLSEQLTAHQRLVSEHTQQAADASSALQVERVSAAAAKAEVTQASRQCEELQAQLFASESQYQVLQSQCELLRTQLTAAQSQQGCQVEDALRDRDLFWKQELAAKVTMERGMYVVVCMRIPWMSIFLDGSLCCPSWLATGAWIWMSVCVCGVALDDDIVYGFARVMTRS